MMSDNNYVDEKRIGRRVNVEEEEEGAEGEEERGRKRRRK